MIKFSLKFLKCDSDGRYWSNEWKTAIVYAEDEREAVEKAKRITNCGYIRALTVEAEELVEKHMEGEK